MYLWPGAHDVSATAQKGDLLQYPQIGVGFDKDTVATAQRTSSKHALDSG